MNDKTENSGISCNVGIPYPVSLFFLLLGAKIILFIETAIKRGIKIDFYLCYS
jgi:hypothetical protein